MTIYAILRLSGHLTKLTKLTKFAFIPYLCEYFCLSGDLLKIHTSLKVVFEFNMYLICQSHIFTTVNNFCHAYTLPYSSSQVCQGRDLDILFSFYFHRFLSVRCLHIARNVRCIDTSYTHIFSISSLEFVVGVYLICVLARLL